MAGAAAGSEHSIEWEDDEELLRRLADPTTVLLCVDGIKVGTDIERATVSPQRENQGGIGT